MMFKKWWAIQHINGGDWIPFHAVTLFGKPLVTVFFIAAGTFKSEELAQEWCDKQNDD